MPKRNPSMIRISLEASNKFRKIQDTRPQDKSNAETFDHILYVYEETAHNPNYEQIRAGIKENKP
jgi:hypothetical protein